MYVHIKKLVGFLYLPASVRVCMQGFSEIVQLLIHKSRLQLTDCI